MAKFLVLARGSRTAEAGAAACYREALARPCAPPERRFIEKQLARCGRQ